MNLTAKLKSWLQEHMDVASDATDEVYRKAAADAFVSGTLTPELQQELCRDEVAEKAAEFASKLDSLLDAVSKNAEAIAELRTESVEEPALKGDAVKSVDVAGMVNAKGNDGAVVNVIEAHTRYDATKSELRYPAKGDRGAHPLANQRVREGDRYIDSPSDRDKAVNGAWFKFMLNGERNIPANLRMTDHDWDLVKYALSSYKFGGVVRGEGSEDEGSIGVKNRKLSEFEQKAVLDDGGASGGLEIVPIAFDDAIITFPLLYGELFPRVNVVNVTRGRRVEGASVANPTLTWGTAEGAEIALFNTASFVTAFDTTIHPLVGVIELGLDFLSDSPVDVGAIVTENYGRRLQAELDRAIAIGTGSGQPTGIMVGAGTTSVASDNGTGGPPTVGDYESLLFAVAKEYKQGFANGDVCFGANETTYQRARGIAVGAGDQRRVFGMTHEDYSLLGRPFCIAADMSNSQVFYANLKRFRMYRRLGMTVRTSTDGDHNMRRNQLMLAIRARYGGQMEDGAAAAVTTDAQS